MNSKPSFTCQSDHCGARRHYERVGSLIIVDACEKCGDATYSLEDVAS